jgi:hypothetical protein
VSDPEAKRKIIGGEFVEVFKAEAQAQGSDESAPQKQAPNGWPRAPSTPT